MNLETQPYKHFSFDLWLTLIKSNPAYKPKRDALFQDFFSIEEDLDKVSKVIRLYDLLCNQISEKTGIHMDTYQIYYLILSALKVNIENIDEIKLNEFYDESERLFMEYRPELVFPKIGSLFGKIRKQGKTMSILSNTAFIKGFSLRKILEHYDLTDYFSFQLYSDELHLSKPNLQVFGQLFQNAGKLQPISKVEILHIGDNAKADYEGAIKAGLNAILI